jgi:hypothetical protein
MLHSPSLHRGKTACDVGLPMYAVNSKKGQRAKGRGRSVDGECYSAARIAWDLG